jgi:hypothetical protein
MSLQRAICPLTTWSLSGRKERARKAAKCLGGDASQRPSGVVALGTATDGYSLVQRCTWSGPGHVDRSRCQASARRSISGGVVPDGLTSSAQPNDAGY